MMGTRPLKYTRESPPADYSVRIDRFSFVQEKMEKYESYLFEVGGYKWRLSVYPDGNRQENGADHISLYLSIQETEALPLDWEVKLDCKFFVYESRLKKYLVIQDKDGEAWRFDLDKTEWGFDQLIDLDTFKSVYVDSNGSCVFGVEISIVKPKVDNEHLSTINDPIDGTKELTIPNFPTIRRDVVYSEGFRVGGHMWKLSVWPNGKGEEAKGKFLSVYLDIADNSTFPPGEKVFVVFKLSLINFSDVVNKSYELEGSGWYSDSVTSHGERKFFSLIELRNFRKGFLGGEVIKIKAQITAMSKVEVNNQPVIRTPGTSKSKDDSSEIGTGTSKPKEDSSETGTWKVLDSSLPSLLSKGAIFRWKIPNFSTGGYPLRSTSIPFTYGPISWKLTCWADTYLTESRIRSTHLKLHLETDDKKNVRRLECTMRLKSENGNCDYARTDKQIAPYNNSALVAITKFDYLVSNGFVSGNSLNFEVEFHTVVTSSGTVTGTTAKPEEDSLSKTVIPFIWTIYKFSSKRFTKLISHEFMFRGEKWKLVKESDSTGWLCFRLQRPNKSRGVHLDFLLRLKNQSGYSDYERTDFVGGTTTVSSCMCTHSFNDLELKGFLLKDTIIVELQFSNLGS